MNRTNGRGGRRGGNAKSKIESESRVEKEFKMMMIERRMMTIEKKKMNHLFEFLMFTERQYLLFEEIDVICFLTPRTDFR